MKIWLITELFYPNESATAYILTEMAKKFVKNNHSVNVICADTNYEGDAKRISDESDQLRDIRIERVKVPELNKNNILKRLLRFITVSIKLFIVAKKNVENGDTVLAVTNPAFLLFYMQRLKRLKGINYVLLVHDVFPENALASGIMKIKPIYYLLKKRFDLAYAAADKIMVLGEDMKEIVAAKTGRKDNVFICENWGASDIEPAERPNDGTIILQYAGNIGRVQGLEELVEVFRKTNNNYLVFDFWGTGALVPFLNNYFVQHHMANARMRGSYNRSTQNKVLNNCDIAIVCLAKGMKGLGVPSKTYNILSAGKPILYIGDIGSEVFNLVKRFDLGWAFDWSQVADLNTLLNSLSPNNLDVVLEKGKRARKCYESFYTMDTILDKTIDIINE